MELQTIILHTQVKFGKYNFLEQAFLFFSYLAWNTFKETRVISYGSNYLLCPFHSMNMRNVTPAISQHSICVCVHDDGTIKASLS